MYLASAIPLDRGKCWTLLRDLADIVGDRKRHHETDPEKSEPKGRLFSLGDPTIKVARAPWIVRIVANPVRLGDTLALAEEYGEIATRGLTGRGMASSPRGKEKEPMRAITLENFESSPGLNEVPTPQIGPDEVLVRVHASSINALDVKIAADLLQGMVEHRFP
jgi:hypothetical protein